MIKIGPTPGLEPLPWLLRSTHGRRMTRRPKVELFESIRREHQFGEVSSIRGLARQFGVHRRMVRQALVSAIPPGRKAAARPRPKLGGFEERVRTILRADVGAPRKQRHTARRIWVRLREEAGCGAAESTVRQLVRRE